MSQPEYKIVGNLGDASPIEHGGFFVYVDTTGVYDPQAELVIPPADGMEDDEGATWTVYRFDLPRCTFDPQSGVLSDNKFHPQHPAWFAQAEAEKSACSKLSRVADFAGIELEELRNWLCSEPMQRAQAYQLIGEYHGWENFDSCPMTFNRAEILERYKDELSFCRARRHAPRS
jgi:hypothetical protein